MSPKVVARDTWMTASSGPGLFNNSAKCSCGEAVSVKAPLVAQPHKEANPAALTYLLPICICRLGEVACLGEQIPQLLADAHGTLRVTPLRLLLLLLQLNHRQHCGKEAYAKGVQPSVPAHFPWVSSDRVDRLLEGWN